MPTAEEKNLALLAVAGGLFDARKVAASCARIIVKAWAGETIQTLEDGDGAKVGKRITNAELALGFELFEAKPTGLVLTKAGRDWVDAQIELRATKDFEVSE